MIHRCAGAPEAEVVPESVEVGVGVLRVEGLVWDAPSGRFKDLKGDPHETGAARPSWDDASVVLLRGDPPGGSVAVQQRAQPAVLEVAEPVASRPVRA